MGRADDPDIGAQGAIAAQALEFLIFDHPQQFFLHPQAGGGDLVEEQRAAIGTLEPTDMAFGSAGKGAGLMTEKLAFEQVLAECCAIDGDQRLIPALRQEMQP